MAQPSARGELLRGRVFGYVLVERLADILALGLAVFVVGVEEFCRACDGFGGPVFGPLGDFLHDRFHQEEEERVSWRRCHPGIGNRVVEAVVGAHSPEEGFPPDLVHVVRRQWPRLRVGHC